MFDLKKKTIVLILILAFVLVGCGKTASNEQKEYTKVYSFCGENEYFSVSNGVVVLTENEEVFYGGTLTPIGDFPEIKSCSMTFYIVDGNEKQIVLSNDIQDMTNGKVNIAGDIGSISGELMLIGNKIETSQDIIDSLWFELVITDLNGNEDRYQIPLSLTEVFNTEKNVEE